MGQAAWRVLAGLLDGKRAGSQILTHGLDPGGTVQSPGPGLDRTGTLEAPVSVGTPS
jgi:hypothetical protein